jgi:phosphatidylserine decarboxylase
MISTILRTELGKMVVVEVTATVIGNIIYKGYKEYCKACWKNFYKK